jgi:hypothetical protein
VVDHIPDAQIFRGAAHDLGIDSLISRCIAWLAPKFVTAPVTKNDKDGEREGRTVPPGDITHILRLVGEGDSRRGLATPAGRHSASKNDPD